MSTPNLILKNWDEQSQAFIANLEYVRKKPYRKAAHDMRVSIKKLRSYVQLCHEITEKDGKHEFDSILLLFRVAGKYRDVEISIILANKHLKKDQVCVPTFTKNLRTHFRFARDLTNETAKKPHEKELEKISSWMHASLEGMTGETLDEKIGKLVTKKLEQLKKLQKDFSENAHEIRKLLKQVYYWTKYCMEKPVLNNKQIKILDTALTCLGDAQDYIVMRSKLKGYRKEYLVKTTEDHEAAKKLEKISKNQEDDLLKQAEENTEMLLKMIEG